MPKGDFSYDHHGWTGKNNYGCVHTYNKGNSKIGKNTVECWMVVSNDEGESPPIVIKETYDNCEFAKDNSSCCAIF